MTSTDPTSSTDQQATSAPTFTSTDPSPTVAPTPRPGAAGGPDQRPDQQASSTPTPRRCDGCGSAVDVAPFQWMDGGQVGMLCHRCRVSSRLYELAEHDLHARVWPVLVAWAGRWHESGLTPRQMEGALHAYGEYWHPAAEYARPSENGDPIAQTVACLLTDAHQHARAAAPWSVAPTLHQHPTSTDQQAGQQASAAPTLSTDQRRNMAARRAEIAETLARCAADLAQMDALERAALS